MNPQSSEYLSKAASEPNHEAYFIRSQTRAGQPFRPSDWVERLASLYATFGMDKKLCYSPWIHPATLGGERGLWLSRGLRQRDPSAFAFVMAFVESHCLAVSTGLR